MSNLLLHIKDYILNNYGLVTNKREDDLIKEFIDLKKIALFDYLNKELIQELINLLTINETYFFRDKNQLNFFKDSCHKLFFKEKKLNIWSIACSSGEEVYTISMILEDINIKSENTIIHGFEINTNHLLKAKNAIYSSWSFRGMDNFYIDNCFEKVGKDKYKVIDKISKNTFFHSFNIKKDLFDPNILRKYGKPDIIFCRNVLMYFDKNIIFDISNKIFELINEEGFLITAIQEIPMFKNTRMKPISSHDTYILYKNNPVVKTTQTRLIKINELKTKIESTKKETEVENIQDIYKQIIATIEKGDTEKSSELIQNQISKDKNNFILYYLESLNYYLCSQFSKAEIYIKKAMFLNNQSDLLNYHYGNIYFSNKDYKKAIIHFKIAKKLINKESNNLELVNIDFNEFKEAIDIMINSLEVKENV